MNTNSPPHLPLKFWAVSADREAKGPAFAY